MSKIDWSKAPPHATHWCPGNARIEPGWIYNPGGNKGEFHSCYADKGLEHIPDFPEWRKARLIPRPSGPGWNGEGLPPVGSEVEIQRGGWCVRKESEGFIGAKVVVRAQFRMGSGAEMIAVDGGADLGCEVFRAEMARPIPTPEQIAAEERNKATDDLFMTMWPNETLHECEPCNPRWRACFNAISAGYRKQEAS